MRIMIVAGLGVSLVLFRGDLIRSWVEQGHEVTAVSPDPEVKAEVEALGAAYRLVPLERAGMNPLKDLALWLALRRLIKAERPELLFCYTVKPVIYGALAASLRRNLRVFSIITGLGYVFLEGGRRGRLLRLLVTRLYRLALRRNEKVFFQNPDDRRAFLEHKIVPAHKTVLVNGSGVNLDHYRQAPLPGGPVVFLLIARLLVEKGIEDYMAAARLLRKRCPEARCRMIGWPFAENPSAIPEERLEAWRREGAVEIFGPTSDVRPYLASCTVYVLPSYREGTPRTVLEAMATGRAVITTDVPGCRETVTEGVNGFLVPVRDSEALAGAMEKFIREPALAVQMGAAGRRMAEEKYDVRKVNRTINEALGLEPADNFLKEQIYILMGKRLFDLSLALLLLVLLAPLTGLIALLVRVKMGKPVIFSQKRPGYRGRPFYLYKFRTMSNAVDGEGRLLPDAERLTPLGQQMRRFSLDELPQLINVIKGELSFVGPRPLLMEYLPRYNREQARRHDVLPGITGWAQVNGRNAITWEEKFAHDVWYVDNRSLWLDLQIMWLTLLQVIRPRGISMEGYTTMPFFMGTPEQEDGAAEANGEGRA